MQASHTIWPRDTAIYDKRQPQFDKMTQLLMTSVNCNMTFDDKRQSRYDLVTQSFITSINHNMTCWLSHLWQGSTIIWRNDSAIYDKSQSQNDLVTQPLMTSINHNMTLLLSSTINLFLIILSLAGDIVFAAGGNYSSLSITGGVVAVHLHWICNLDFHFQNNCLPK